MEINLQELAQHYRNLSDEQLRSLDRDDLTREAQRFYDYEIKHRNLTEDDADSLYTPVGQNRSYEEHADSDWLESSACACSFTEYPGSNAAMMTEKALEALAAAGIPCQTDVVPDEEDRNRSLVNIMVPGASILHATSIVERDLFNDDYETEWTAHLESLSDRELLTLDPKLICAGMLDRIARIQKIYSREMQKRSLPLRT
jgi:hypothetical protein